MRRSYILFRESYADEFLKRGIQIPVYSVKSLKDALKECAAYAISNAGMKPTDELAGEIRSMLNGRFPDLPLEEWNLEYMMAMGNMSRIFDFMIFYGDNHYITGAIEDDAIFKAFGREGVRMDGIAKFDFDENL